MGSMGLRLRRPHPDSFIFDFLYNGLTYHGAIQPDGTLLFTVFGLNWVDVTSVRMYNEIRKWEPL